jgi:hypothetical protein
MAPLLYSVRVPFEEAAHHYGKMALRERLGSNVSEMALRKIISRVLARVPSSERLPRAA